MSLNKWLRQKELYLILVLVAILAVGHTFYLRFSYEMDGIGLGDSEAEISEKLESQGPAIYTKGNKTYGVRFGDYGAKSLEGGDLTIGDTLLSEGTDVDTVHEILGTPSPYPELDDAISGNAHPTEVYSVRNFLGFTVVTIVVSYDGTRVRQIHLSSW